MKFKLTTLACLVGMSLAGNALAATDTSAEVKKLRQEVNALNAKAKEWEEWKAPKTLVHLAGFASVGFTQPEKGTGSFSTGSFSPIFHYQFAEDVMMEAELEFEGSATGASVAGIDYMTIDYFMNDYAALVVGKFLSPIGQFRQNIHPSWINKMAAAPVGFGHDQAAPNADVGMMVRGGFTTDSGSHNYALYVANGPTLEPNTAGTEIEMIETPGLNQDVEGAKVVGGRYGLFFAEQQLDIGFSAAVGGTSVRLSTTNYESARSYQVVGFDMTWRVAGFDVRAEYVSQKVGDSSSSSITDGGTWTAMYAQIAYKFNPSNWEAVLRYGQYDTPDAASDVNQVAAGLNYVFASNVVAKFNYELNTNPNAGQTAENRMLAQLAYGF